MQRAPGEAAEAAEAEGMLADALWDQDACTSECESLRGPTSSLADYMQWY